MTRRLAREEGLLVGHLERRQPRRARCELLASSAARAPAQSGFSRRRDHLPDGGERYLSETFLGRGRLMAITLARDGRSTRSTRTGARPIPNECCGALIGRDGVVTEAFALPNTTEEGPRRRFLVRPGDYRAAEARAAETGSELLGFYHSHPDHPARPSQYDLDHAWPLFSYVIVSVMQRRARRPAVVAPARGSIAIRRRGQSMAGQNSHSDTAAPVHRQARRRRARRRQPSASCSAI